MAFAMAMQQVADIRGSRTAQAQAVAQANSVSDRKLVEGVLGHVAGLLGLPWAEEQPCLSEAV